MSRSCRRWRRNRPLKDDRVRFNISHYGGDRLDDADIHADDTRVEVVIAATTTASETAVTAVTEGRGGITGDGTDAGVLNEGGGHRNTSWLLGKVRKRGSWLVGWQTATH